MPFKNGKLQKHETVWTEEMISFLKQNFFTLTNQQLATALNLRLTVTRNKCAELGLKRIEMEYWTKEQVNYLVQHYKTMGDVEIAAHFQKTWPKKKQWKKQHVAKKRGYLKLYRTVEEQMKIVHANVSPGGRSFTILKNSCSLNAHPGWVAQQMAWRNKPMQQALLQQPELLQAGRNIILIKRALKTKADATK